MVARHLAGLQASDRSAPRVAPRAATDHATGHVTATGHAAGPEEARVASRFVGVTWDKSNRKWKAKAPNVNGKQLDLGRFGTEREAALKYDDEARKLGKPLK